MVASLTVTVPAKTVTGIFLGDLYSNLLAAEYSPSHHNGFSRQPQAERK
ncbi:MAG: hypothetical protein P5702_11945 [Limnospira sp. PMC 1291.21]|uniref:Uncharacterized protein n=3 Tax=Limnospira TaxID=2596745 RepID=A0A9P1NXT1_9CYAN|nr:MULTISPECIES: hypothetical protein [Limnospira]EKD11390.1 hypothetical protein SPLC1_S032200 [Arthrospira platensis C1]MDC0838621.1 hypothetical protein [Limnoraphis robusta]MDY7053352.1 hypothetical protein [Limnospira fusiformis LS22]QJB27566.1 hypothetical protein HFV01_19430 [Limnospira fusiformis SAG 85.79]EDZ96815.1 hypothetical protein AmaxDRAFT_0304 [Limnospira maxima CS-328]